MALVNIVAEDVLAIQAKSNKLKLRNMNKTKLIIGLLSLTFFFHSCKKVDDVKRSFEEVNLEQFKSNLIGKKIGNSLIKIVDIVIKKSDDSEVSGLIILVDEDGQYHKQLIRDFKVSTNYIKGGDGYFNLSDNLYPETIENKVLNKYDNADYFYLSEMSNDNSTDEESNIFYLNDNNKLVFQSDDNNYEGTYYLTEIVPSDDNDKELDMTQDIISNDDVQNFLNTASNNFNGKIKLNFKNDGEEKELSADFSTIDEGYLLKNGVIRNLSVGNFVDFYEMKFLGNNLNSFNYEQTEQEVPIAEETAPREYNESENIDKTDNRRYKPGSELDRLQKEGKSMKNRGEFNVN